MKSARNPDPLFLEQLRQRKGAVRTADIPAEILLYLNTGHLTTANLTEWLAVDHRLLLRSVLPQIGLSAGLTEKGALAAALAHTKITERLNAVGKALAGLLNDHSHPEAAMQSLASHTSDTVRTWANHCAVAASLNLRQRLEATRPFAADEHFGVRECAWMIFRPYLIAELQAGLKLLQKWVTDRDANIRRFATEVSRPRGVWCEHIQELKTHPEIALPLLEKVRADNQRYVQLSVANWLNDASRSRPDFVRDVCQRWQAESPGSETAWIINHALRTLRKQ